MAKRIPVSGWLVGILVLAGCARDEDYLQVMRDQRDAMKEIADVLESVKDEKSMADAKKSLDELKTKTAEISQRANALPKPPPRRVQERMEEDKFFTERTFDRLRREVKRVREMPGGPELLKQFDAGSPGLLPKG